MTERARLVLAEIGAHTGARNSLGRKMPPRSEAQIDPSRRRLLAKTVEQERLSDEHTTGALELARVQIVLGGDVHWEWPDQCAAWNLGYLQKGVRDLCLETTRTTGCALGVRHTSEGTGRRTRANCIHVKKTIGQRRSVRVNAAAAGSGTDDHHMEVGSGNRRTSHQETEKSS